MPYAQTSPHNSFPSILLALTLPIMLLTAMPATLRAFLPANFNPQGPIFPESLSSSAASAPADNQGAGASASFNWAGYAAIGNFSGVSGSWHVPAVAPSDANFASDATWVGVGGVESTDLIQAGTEALVENGEVTYRAWYELLPYSMHYAPLQVHAGDQVAVSVVAAGPALWQISIVNGTTGKSYQTTVTYDSSFSSAEWIEERPSLATGQLLPLDQFGSIDLEGAYAIQSDGVRQSAADVGATPISMLSRRGTLAAQPSLLGSDGASFSISQSNPSVSAPAAAVVAPTSPVSQQPNVSQIPAEDTLPSPTELGHGAYYVWVNGNIVEEKHW